MCGYDVVNIASGEDGCVDLDALRAALGEDTAGVMLTNPNTVGIFDRNILEITRLVHEAGGLCYYDGANLNAVMGVVRPGDMGFDCIHMNLHNTLATSWWWCGRWPTCWHWAGRGSPRRRRTPC